MRLTHKPSPRNGIAPLRPPRPHPFAPACADTFDHAERQLPRQFRPLSGDFLCKSPAGQRSNASSRRSGQTWSGTPTGLPGARRTLPAPNTCWAFATQAESILPSAGNHPYPSNKGSPDLITRTDLNSADPMPYTICLMARIAPKRPEQNRYTRSVPAIVQVLLTTTRALAPPPENPPNRRKPMEDNQAAAHTVAQHNCPIATSDNPTSSSRPSPHQPTCPSQAKGGQSGRRTHRGADSLLGQKPQEDAAPAWDHQINASDPALSPSDRSARTAWAGRPNSGCAIGFPTGHPRHSPRQRSPSRSGGLPRPA